MASYFDEHNCEPLEAGQQPNHHLHLARLLLDSGVGAELELEFGRIFGGVDGRKQPPAAKHVIDGLKSTNKFNADEKCAVCLKEFDLNGTKELPCRHKFCTDCIVRWLKLVNSCPMCRVELPTDDHDYEEYKKQKERVKERQVALDELHNSMFS
ncbi:unnamed protein product [Didymodactylos carnosus]|uniref:RING-type domain-containing protein n=1 Tax=Didymodactylos carnosus TaxID=1234261 RepID=A0A814DKF0_9BILA|nr:unnamed protein product [Didymodactylos carnosus]CAF3731837.1 unnamed protein product [Didymodactylos carnosus]